MLTCLLGSAAALWFLALPGKDVTQRIA